MFATKFEDNIDLGFDAICLSICRPSIAAIFTNIESDQARVGYYAQTIATEYWIANQQIDAEYVGVTGYRRYPIFNPNIRVQGAVVNIESSWDNIKLLSEDSNLNYVYDIFKYYDVIIPKKSESRVSLRDQFLSSEQSIDIWELFIRTVSSLNPEYRKNIDWFDLPQYSHFYGPMGLTPSSLYKEYANEYFEVIKIMLKSIKNPFFILNYNAVSLSDRWIGYLAERFYPFFLHIRRVSTFEVPIALLHEAG